MNQDRIQNTMMLLVLIALTGCRSHDERLVEFARQVTDEQTRQNERMAEQSQSVAQSSEELAAAARELVEQDATARREMIHAHNESQNSLDRQRQELSKQREAVHAERQAAAAAALREPVVAEAVLMAGLVLATLLPLLVTAYALHRLPSDGEGTGQLLTTFADELTRDLTRALDGSQAHVPLPDGSSPRLSGPESPPGDSPPDG